MEQKPNDMLLNIMSNPSYDIKDFYDVGLDVENTSLQKKDVYQNSPQIQDFPAFKNSEGNFNQTAFDQTYNKAVIAYNYMANQKADQDFQRYYSKYDPWAPKDKVDYRPQFNINTKEFNPDRTSYSIIKVGQEGPKTKSAQEIAQSQKVYNGKTGEWEDSPEDSFFGTMFGDTRVLASYDADVDKNGVQRGDAGFDENNIVHHEGELKISPETGTYYYETLNGRNIRGKQVLHMSDIITREDSPINAIDVLDSDDIHKSGIGSFVKNAALIGSLFIPGAGPYIVGATILQQALGLGATLGKIATSSDNGFFNYLQGVSEATNLSTSRSDYAQQHLWTAENLFGMVADTVTQLTQQRMLFQQLPRVFGKDGRILTEKGQDAMQKELMEKFNAINPMKGKIPSDGVVDVLNAQNKITLWNQTKATQALEKYMKDYYNMGGVLSKAYMTLLTVNDIYDEAKHAGASDTVAALTTLGYAAAEYGLLSTGLGEWILPELRQARMQSKAMIKALSKDTLKTFEIEGRKATTDEAKHKFYSKVINFGKKLFTADYAVGRQGTLGKTITSTLAGGLGEGTEEVSEDILQDFVKRLYNLGNAAFGSDSRMHTENWQDQYAMSFLGGFLGGGIANVTSSFQTARASQNMTSQQAMQRLVYTMRNPEEFDNFMKVLNKTEIGNKYLSTKEITDENGNRIGYEQGTKEDNQDKFIKDLIKQNINLVKTSLETDGAQLSDESLIKDILPDLKWQYLYNSTSTAYLIQRYNDLATQALQIRNELNNTQLSDPKLREDSPEVKAVKDHEKELQTQLKNVQDEIKNIREGKYTARYMADALLETTPLLLDAFLKSATFKGYVETKTGQKYENIPESRLENLRKEYVDYLHTDAKYDIHQATNVYLDFQRKFKDYLAKIASQYSTVAQQPLIETIGRVNAVLNSENSEEALKNAQAIEAAENNFIPIYERFDDAIASYNEYVKDINNPKNFQDFLTKLEEALKYVDTKLNMMVFNSLPATVKYNLTNQLENLQKGLLKTVEEFDNIIAPPNLQNQFDDLRDRLLELASDSRFKTLKSEIDQASYTPILEIADQFDLTINGNPLTFSTLFEQLQQLEKQSAQDVTQFAIPKNLSEKIGQAQILLRQLEAMVEGARTDDAGLEVIDTKTGKAKDNIWGINVTLNQVAEETHPEDWEKLPEISGQVADALLVDIRALQSKLLYYTTLYGINQGQKLASQPRINTKIAYLFYNKLKIFKDTVPDDWDKSKLENVFTNCIFLSEHCNDTTLNLSTEDYAKLKTEQIQLEDAVYDFLQDNKDRDFSDLFKDGFAITSDKTLLNETTEGIDNNSFIGWFIAKGALKTSTFLKTLQPVLKARPELVPLDSQLMGVQLAVANAVNGDFVTKIANAATTASINYLNNLRNKDKYEFIKYCKKLGISEELAAIYSTDTGFKYISNNNFFYRWKNISLVEGIAGSGKSSAVLQLVADYLRQNYGIKNPWVVNTTQESKNVLKQKLKSEGEAYTKEELLGVISDYTQPPISDTGSIKLDGTNTTIEDGKITSNAKLKDVTDVPKVIIIDEVSRFTTQELDLLDKFAQKYGISIITAGDFDQSQTTGKVNLSEIASGEIQQAIAEANGAKIDKGNGTTVTVPADYEVRYIIDTDRNNIIHAPKIGTAIRTENSQIDVNQSTIIASQESLAKDATYSIDLKLHYWEDEKEIRGTKVVRGYDKVKEITDFLDKVIPTLKDGEKVGFTYYNDKEGSIYEVLSKNTKYSDHIEFYKGNTAQGYEGKYWIIESNPNVTTETYLKDIYTGITRAKVGSLLIVPKVFGVSATEYDNRINNRLTNIDSVQDVDSTQIHLLDSEKKAFNEKYAKILEGVLENASDQVQQYTERNTISPQQPPTQPTQPPPGSSTPTVTFDADKLRTAQKEAAEAAQKDLKDLQEVYDRYKDINPTSEEDKKRLETFLKDVQKQITAKKVAAIPVTTGLDYTKLSRNEEVQDDGSIIYTFTYTDGSPVILSHQWVNKVFGKKYTKDKALKNITVNKNGSITLKEQGRISEISSFSDPELTDLTIPDYDTLGGDVSTQEDSGERLLQEEQQQNGITPPRITSGFLLTSDLTDPAVQSDAETFIQNLQDNPWMGHRIDGLYGMFTYVNGKLQPKFKNIDSVDKAKEVLNKLYGYILNIKDKSELVQICSGMLGLSNADIVYAIKSGQTTGFVENDFAKFDKTQEEADRGSDTRGFKEIVAIISSNGKDVLEIPITRLNSPQSKISSLFTTEDWQTIVNGFGDEISLLIQLRDNPKLPLWDIIKNILHTDSNAEKEITALKNWIYLYLATNNLRAIYYCPDPNWTIASMKSLGPQWDYNRGFKYVTHTALSQPVEVHPITDSLNSRIYTSEVMLIKSNQNKTSSGKLYVQFPNSMFILFSSDPELNSTDKLWKEYLQEVEDETRPKKVMVKYLQTPTVSIEAYLQSVLRFTLGKKEGTKHPPFGNRTTAYKVVRALWSATDAKDALVKLLPRGEEQYKFIQDQLQQLFTLSEDQLSTKLASRSDWSTIGGYGNKSLNTQFINVLTQLCSKTGINNVDSASEITTINKEQVDQVCKIFNSTKSRIYLAGRIKKSTGGIYQLLDVQPGYKLPIDMTDISANVDSTLTIVGKLGTDSFETDSVFQEWLQSAVNNTQKNTHDVYYSVENRKYLRGESSQKPPSPSFNSEISKILDILKTRGVDISKYAPARVNDSGKSYLDTLGNELAALGYFAVRVNDKLFYTQNDALMSYENFGTTSDNSITNTIKGRGGKKYSVTVDLISGKITTVEESQPNIPTQNLNAREQQQLLNQLQSIISGVYSLNKVRKNKNIEAISDLIQQGQYTEAWNSCMQNSKSLKVLINAAINNGIQINEKPLTEDNSIIKLLRSQFNITSKCNVP